MGKKTPFLPSKTHHFYDALPTSKERPQAPLEEGQERRREGRVLRIKIGETSGLFHNLDQEEWINIGEKKPGVFDIFYQEKVIEQDWRIQISLGLARQKK